MSFRIIKRLLVVGVVALAFLVAPAVPQECQNSLAVGQDLVSGPIVSGCGSFSGTQNGGNCVGFGRNC